MNLDELKKTVIAGDIEACVELTKKGMEAKIPAKEMLNKGLLAGLEIVGDQFQKGEAFFPELLMSAKALKTATELLKPELSKRSRPPTGKFLIGTVMGDMHDIGKNIVSMMLQQHEWEVTDLGTDVPVESFCKVIGERSFDVLGLSAMLTFTMGGMAEIINALKAEGLKDKVKIMIGGAPVTQSFAGQIGADAYGKDAIDAVKKANNLINYKREA